MIRKRFPGLALGITSLCTVSGCMDEIPGNQGGRLPEARTIEEPHPMQGLWRGRLSQRIPEAAERQFVGLIAADGDWLFAALDDELAAEQTPVETVWGRGSAPFIEQQTYRFSGRVFDADDALLDWGASGPFEAARAFNGEYRVFQGGFGSPALTQRSGTFAVDYDAEYEIGSSADLVAGDYASETVRVSINALDERQAPIAGIGDAGSQIGSCTFSGLIAPIDTRFNAYRGTADLRQERCETGGDPAFSLLAYLVTTAGCANDLGPGPNTLVLAMRNGDIDRPNGTRSHYFHRLCRIR
jgi:hypothetical protein